MSVLLSAMLSFWERCGRVCWRRRCRCVVPSRMSGGFGEAYCPPVMRCDVLIAVGPVGRDAQVAISVPVPLRCDVPTLLETIVKIVMVTSCRLHFWYHRRLRPLTRCGRQHGVGAQM